MSRKRCSRLEKIIQDFKTEFPDITKVVQDKNKLTFRLPGNIWIFVTIKDWDLWEVRIEKMGMYMDEDIIVAENILVKSTSGIKHIIDEKNTANDNSL